ncbi:uncharacterized protein K444DRAFT_604409 [Hyaloscypha bicolor E]|uniref:Uncharacterized protein n=1 Tax=Hyaloscypha bicolor E TaxID=1095630 RepID=A0A2J6SJF8_9HELO|nr:uncharacterized protein K444DRAFT_604409 [Hyaloscypha bicolor E]PMD50909.1 hypothetical protein K444DRAFT_604409 [Hyaloscypha bicolor E]
MGTETRSLTVVNQGPDLTALAQNHYNLQVAKSVAKGDKIIFNIVWQSKVLAPRINVKWKPIYGLNWTMDIPSDGLQVTLGGLWRQCDLGQVIDLDETGQWTQSTSQPVIDFLAIGNNKFKSGTVTNGIHIIVGVQNSPGAFDPIFVDPTELGPNMSASYQPQEQLQWWYEEGMKTSTMISTADTTKEVGDYSKPDPKSGLFSKTSSYTFNTGKWLTGSP